MDESTAESLLGQVLEGDDTQRADAFLQLLCSAHWKMVLAPHVASLVRDTLTNEQLEKAAESILGDEERVQACLGLVGSGPNLSLLLRLAQKMGSAMVEVGLEHLRTADGARAANLEEILYLADPRWVLERAARRAIRNRLRIEDTTRVRMMQWLADAGNLDQFIDDVRQVAPRYLEEWSALGLAAINDETLLNRALATLGRGPEPLAYLACLDPIPPDTLPRAMAAAKPEWLLAALEVLMLEGITRQELIPVVELATRLGGRHLSAAVVWIGAAKLGPTMLNLLADELRGTDRREFSRNWQQRRTASSNRALEQIQAGEAPAADDVAALVRQLQGDRMAELIDESLVAPAPLMFETLLRHLCAVNPDAAIRVAAHRRNPNPTIAARVTTALEWPDVEWPEIEEDDLPDTFTPLGRGI